MPKKMFVGVALLAVPLVVLQVLGWMLPREHQASVEIELPLSPEAVFVLITDVEQAPEWRTNLDEVEVLSTDPLRFREVADGDELLFEEHGRRAPLAWGTRIADPELPFGGTWTFRLEPLPTGSRVTITEDGFVDPPIFRVLSLAFGHDTTLRRYAADLEVECHRRTGDAKHTS